MNVTTSIGKTDGVKLEELCKKGGITKYKFVKNVLLKEIARDISEATGHPVWIDDGEKLLERVDANNPEEDFIESD